MDRAKQNRPGQRPESPDRLYLEALLYWGRTGVPWRDLPSEFGAWDAVDNRFRRWVRSGRLKALPELLTADPARGAGRGAAGADRLDHRPGAPARGRGGSQERPGRGLSAAVQGLGRRRGGRTTEVILTAADEDTAVAVDRDPG